MDFGSARKGSMWRDPRCEVRGTGESGCAHQFWGPRHCGWRVGACGVQQAKGVGQFNIRNTRRIKLGRRNRRKGSVNTGRVPARSAAKVSKLPRIRRGGDNAADSGLHGSNSPPRSFRQPGVECPVICAGRLRRNNDHAF